MRAIWEVSKSSLYVEGPTLDMPESTGNNLRQLSHDHDSMIAFEVLRTTAMLERALLEQLLDAEAKKVSGQGRGNGQSACGGHWRE